MKKKGNEKKHFKLLLVQKAKIVVCRFNIRDIGRK